MLSLAVVTGVAVLVGFRPTATAAEWIAAFGLLAAFTLAITWLSVALGLVSRSVETASNRVFLILLPSGRGFVPTDSMPTGRALVRRVPTVQPVIETLRGLLLGKPIDANGALAAAWIVGIGLFGYVWANRLFERRSPR